MDNFSTYAQEDVHKSAKGGGIMIFLSALLRQSVYDSEGRRLGGLRDVCVALNETFPVVTALVVHPTMGKRFGANGIDQPYDKCGCSEEKSRARTEPRSNRFGDASRREKQHHAKVKCECGQRSRERAAAVTLPRGIESSGKRQSCPQAERGKHTELAHSGQVDILTYEHVRFRKTPCVHRLDERFGVRLDVSGALL